MRPPRELLPLGLRKSIKAWRAETTLALGSQRYAFPALNGMDRKVLPRLPSDGVFLEIGANDGYSQSNTYHLERVRGWRGILVEPLPSLFVRCERLRKQSVCFNVACVADDAVTPFIEMADLDLMSVALGQQPDPDESARLEGDGGKRVQVPTRRLSDLIDASPFDGIDFMSIDVEGAELQLLAGLDLARHAPAWLLIETQRLEEVSAACSPWLVYEEQLSYHDHLFRRVS